MSISHRLRDGRSNGKVLNCRQLLLTSVGVGTLLSLGRLPIAAGMTQAPGPKMLVKKFADAVLPDFRERPSFNRGEGTYQWGPDAFALTACACATSDLSG